MSDQSAPADTKEDDMQITTRITSQRHPIQRRFAGGIAAAVTVAIAIGAGCGGGGSSQATGSNSSPTTSSASSSASSSATTTTVGVNIDPCSLLTTGDLTAALSKTPNGGPTPLPPDAASQQGYASGCSFTFGAVTAYDPQNPDHAILDPGNGVVVIEGTSDPRASALIASFTTLPAATRTDVAGFDGAFWIHSKDQSSSFVPTLSLYRSGQLITIETIGNLRGDYQPVSPPDGPGTTEMVALLHRIADRL